jgi:hypothetical protein
MAIGLDCLAVPPAHGLDPQGLAGAVNPHGPAAFPDTGRIDPVALGIALGAVVKLCPRKWVSISMAYFAPAGIQNMSKRILDIF